ncbi:hypothetical protein [Modestobacter altitudinis]|uniref:hypothetical protein n=1 Tax=Modestobacter altitudinis TaxID=2213158 RepID=UPI00110C9B98|nr:hypothetical protein [Modestobacter altitudinis]
MSALPYMTGLGSLARQPALWNTPGWINTLSHHPGQDHARSASLGGALLGRSVILGSTALLLALTVGCTASEDTSEAASPTTPSPASSPTAAPTTAPAVSAPTAAPDEADVPVERDADYTEAASVFGDEGIRLALLDDARIARLALADCRRWRTGQVDPELAALVSPQLLDRALEELDGPTGSPPSLLSDLPTHDGNGHNEAAAVRKGCDGSSPLHYETSHRQAAVTVDRTGTRPRLRMVATCAMNVRFGDEVVGAAQDWTFTSTPTASGWLLTDAATTADVNWFPGLPEG